MQPKPHFFASHSDWRKWLEKHHADTQELWVGLYKRDSGRASISWPEAVDGALCFGWIDGVRKGIDAESYMNRFTPRKPRSVWSVINIKRAAELIKKGLMHPAGATAFAKREASNSPAYSYEQRKKARLPTKFERDFRVNRKAWHFFVSQPPWYQRTAALWVISAKKEETQRKRLDTLIRDSAHQRTIAPLTRPRKK